MVLPDMVAIDDMARRADGLVTYEVFGTPFVAPALPPCFTFGTLPDYLAPDLYAENEIGGVGLYRLHDAHLTFDAIILQREVALWSLALNHPENHVRSILSAQAVQWQSMPVRRIAGQAAIIHGPGFDIFGHWLVDFLPRLLVLHESGVDIETLSFVVPVGLPAFARSLLRGIGIPEAKLVWHDQRTERLAPDELLVPTYLRRRSRFHPLIVPATQFWCERFSERSALPNSAGGGRRIFVSRGRHGGARRLQNRADIESCAAKAGYDIVFPETLSLAEQIGMFRSSSCILGEYGSGLHGSIFACPGSVVCALRGTSHHPGFAQSGLAERFGHKMGYVFANTPEHAADCPYSIDTGAFRHALSAVETWSTANAGSATIAD